MTDSVMWWVATGVFVGLELITGTFYLLMVALGLAAAALVSYLGVSLSTEMLCAALVGGGAVTAWHVLKGRRPQDPPAQANHDVNLDIGESVNVMQWHRTASVKYRGANWTVEALPGAALATGMHRVKEVVGSHLIVEKI